MEEQGVDEDRFIDGPWGMSRAIEVKQNST